MTEWEKFQSYLDFVKSHFNSMKTWSDEDKLQESVRAIETEIKRLKEEGVCHGYECDGKETE